MSDIAIINGDALDLDADFFAQFDTLITDPPYSPHVHENAASVGVAGGDGLGAHARDLGFDALGAPLRQVIASAIASVRRWSAVFSDVESAHEWRDAAAVEGAEYIRTLPWIRWSQPQLSGDRPCTILELVSVFHRAEAKPRGGISPVKKRWNGPGNIMPTVSRELLASLQQRALRGAGKHPTEKRLSQLLELVSWFSDPGESVLDLCAGSCTTALAARLLGRDCVCIELDEEWARKGEIRATTNLSPRDRADAEEWCGLVYAEAEPAAAAPLLADGSNRNTIERAARRLADVERVMGAL